MIDACYPLGRGSKLNNEEIRFSLRSLLANAVNLRRVYIVGEKPDFLRFGERLIHIPYEEKHGPYRNVWEKLKVVANDDRISERFVFMNDDFFIVKKFDAMDFPMYTRGGKLSTMKSNGKLFVDQRVADLSKPYHRCLRHTLAALDRRGLTSFTYSTHQPVGFEKTRVREVYKEFEKELQAPYGLSFRCCYGNFYQIERVVRPTNIVRRRWAVPGGRLAFASHQDVDPAMFMNKISAMFPQKTVFER